MTDSAREIAELRALLTERKAELAAARAELTGAKLQIEQMKAQLAKLRRVQFGRSSERLDAQIHQLELMLEDLEEGEAARTAPSLARGADQPGRRKCERRQPVRRPLPDHLPREEIVLPSLKKKFSVRQEFSPRNGQADAGFLARKQLLPKQLLECCNSDRNCRLSDVKAIGRLVEILGIYELKKGSRKDEVHGRSFRRAKLIAEGKQCLSGGTRRTPSPTSPVQSDDTKPRCAHQPARCFLRNASTGGTTWSAASSRMAWRRTDRMTSSEFGSAAAIWRLRRGLQPPSFSPVSTRQGCVISCSQGDISVSA